MLSFMIVVTMTAPDLAAVEAAYSRHLRYRVADRGQVSDAACIRMGHAAHARVGIIC